MAMLRLGKLKFRFKDGGVDFRWGDGEAHRLGLGRKNAGNEEYDLYPEDYVENTDSSDLDYDGRFAQSRDDLEEDYADDDYRDDGYADDGYGDYEDRYADDGYDDGGYDDDGYADDGYDDDGDYEGRYADDGYDDDGYADDGGYDDDGYADDGYDDGGYDDDGYVDDQGGYGDDGYADGGYGYEQSGYPEGGMGALLQYVDENDWVTYLLLFLLPPLGIYLLWRRQRFDQTIRYAISGASAVWFIVLIVLLSMAIFGGTHEQTGEPVIPTAAPTSELAQADASPSPSPSTSPEASASAMPNVSGAISPSATPIGGVSPTASTGDLVYVTATGSYYHNKENCGQIPANQAVTQVTLELAKSQNRYACPECYGGDIYYATTTGQWYHLDEHCSKMENATVYSKEKAEAEGKEPCPVCVTKERDSLYDLDNVTFITTSTTDKSGVKVWCTTTGENYHVTEHCRNMSGAKQVSLKEALLSGKTACWQCCAVAGELYWCTKTGTYYHTDEHCPGMSNPSQVTFAEACVLGKKKCPICQPDTTTPEGSGNNTEGYYVYARPDGNWYHLDSGCRGMENAVRVPLSLMVEIGREPCPDCCAGANMSVYVTNGGTYYHSYASCSKMENAQQTTLAEALAAGFQRCNKCWSGNATVPETGAEGDEPTADSVMVYATKEGSYYHTIDSCSGIGSGEVYRGPLRLAIQAGKTACPNCAAAAQMTVYSNDNGRYYHQKDCPDVTGAKQRTLAEALMLGQQKCPTCWDSSDQGDNSGNSTQVNNFTVGKSGIKVYASISASEPYFHTQSNCSGRSGLTQVPLEVALNYGKTACPTCASGAASTVYATQNGRYYHISRSCAGDGAVAGTLANALAYGFTACPYCVTGTQTVPPTGGNFTSGTSGIMVYATVDGAYYHTSQSHAGSGAVQVTLETALNYGKRACPDCSAIAELTIYGVPGSMTFHSNRNCAGDNAVAGTLAQALAYGMHACPNCIGNEGGGILGGNGGEYSAPESTVVYVDLYSTQFYYHKSKSCPGSGMTNGTAQTLEFAKDFGYIRCPYCNPPSDIS